MFDINEEYNYLKDSVAKAYGISIINNVGDTTQVRRISNDSLSIINDFENIFNNANLYDIKDAMFNEDLVGLCYIKNTNVGMLYHRIAMFYGIGKYYTSDINSVILKVDKICANVRDYLQSLAGVIRNQYNVKLFNSKEEVDWLNKACTDDKIIYLLNIFLAMFIKQINNEILGTTKDDRLAAYISQELR